MLRRYVISFFFILSSCCGWTQEVAHDSLSPEGGFTGIAVYVDQDAVYPYLNEDRDYSFGQGIGLAGAWINHRYNPFRYPLHCLDYLPSKWLGLENGKTYHTMTLADKAYTPDSLEASAIIDTDRPYANIFFVNFGRRTVSKDEKLMLQSDFRLGVLGTYVGREIQSFFHGIERNRRGGTERPVDPQGWNNQISDGGELTGLLRWQFGYNPFGNAKSGPFQFQYIPKLDLTLGYQNYLGASLELKLGRIYTPWWVDESNAMEYGNAFYKPSDKQFELYAFARGSYQLVFYDALLQGQFKSSAYTLSAGQIERNIYLFEAGGTLRFRYFKTWVSMNHRSAAFTLQGRNHFWVTMAASFIIG